MSHHPGGNYSAFYTDDYYSSFQAESSQTTPGNPAYPNRNFQFYSNLQPYTDDSYHNGAALCGEYTASSAEIPDTRSVNPASNTELTGTSFGSFFDYPRLPYPITTAQSMVGKSTVPSISIISPTGHVVSPTASTGLTVSRHGRSKSCEDAKITKPSKGSHQRARSVESYKLSSHGQRRKKIPARNPFTRSENQLTIDIISRARAFKANLPAMGPSESLRKAYSMLPESCHQVLAHEQGDIDRQRQYYRLLRAMVDYGARIKSLTNQDLMLLCKASHKIVIPHNEKVYRLTTEEPEENLAVF
jgi:hypothetical protein